MQAIKADNPNMLIDWIRDNCVTIEVFREIKDWAIQKLQQSLDKNNHGQDEVSYLLSPARIVPAVGESFDGYTFEIMIKHANAEPEMAVTFFRANEAGRIAGTLGRNSILSWTTIQDEDTPH